MAGVPGRRAGPGGRCFLSQRTLLAWLASGGRGAGYPPVRRYLGPGLPPGTDRAGNHLARYGMGGGARSCRGARSLLAGVPSPGRRRVQGRNRRRRCGPLRHRPGGRGTAAVGRIGRDLLRRTLPLDAEPADGPGPAGGPRPANGRSVLATADPRRGRGRGNRTRGRSGADRSPASGTVRPGRAGR